MTGTAKVMHYSFQSDVSDALPALLTRSSSNASLVQKVVMHYRPCQASNASLI